MTSNHHQSVMFDESIEGLNIQKNGTYIDATFGRGGHTRGILDKLGDQGRVIAFDQDISAIEFAKKQFNDSRLTLIHSAFSNLKRTLEEQNLVGKINGVLMDLGVSSPQLDNAQRGFSFNADGPLDMRMDQTRGESAAQWLEKADATEIADVIYQYGEEKKSRAIARAIKQYQVQKPITTTQQLSEIIRPIVKSKHNKNPATRTFQAIRIHINQELDQLKQALQQSLSILAPNGRLCIISFHSIEDRIVKQFIQKNSTAKPLPKGLPIIQQDIEPSVLKNLGKQMASQEEITFNKRSRSAILRIAQRNKGQDYAE